MAQDCFLTFGICRQMIMMQPGKLSILPLESKQWGLAPWVTSYTAQIRFPISFSNTNYILVATGRIEDDSKAIIGGVLYNHKETIGCILRGTEEKGPAAEYIALGT